ncbi:MAG: ankyrin repeat domain-containing protein [Nitrospira sp.]|nr:ankyrin repeat domain-containing protein [Nitrospira sp.]
MTTVHPVAALPASSALTPSHAAQTAVCPLCQAITSCTPAADQSLHQFPCPSCQANLLVLNPATRPTDEDRNDRSGEDDLPLDLSRRLAGIAVAALACALNYVLLVAMAYWMLGQVKTTHDPYDIDALVLSPFILNAHGWTPLHLAAARGDQAAVAALLAEGQTVDQRNGNGRTALFEAAKRGHTDVVTLLVQHGANPNAKGKQGLPPLLAAAEQGHADTIEALLTNGADIRATCTGGDSALHRAVRRGHLAAAQTLLEGGIPVNQKSHGETPLEIAQHDEDHELIALLRAHGGKEFSDAKAKRAEGIAFQKQGQIDKALFAYAEALNLDPDDHEAYYGRGTALLQKDAPDEALIAFHATIRLDPTYINAYSAAASVHTARGQWDQAVTLWDQFLAHQPQHGRAYFELAIVKRGKGDSAGFLQGLQQACALGHQAAC